MARKLKPERPRGTPILADDIRSVNAEVFWAKVTIPADDESSNCWLWGGNRMRSGHGVTFIPSLRTTTLAHRVAWVLLGYDLPAPGYHLDHLCRVTNCVNPEHLEPVTPRENTLRGVGVSAQNAAKTHCVHGHEFSPENTHVYPDGRRDCKTCRTANWRRNRAKRVARAKRGAA